MFVLAYRNNNGALRVGPRAYATAAQAGGFAQYYLRRSGEFAGVKVSLFVIDLTTILKEYSVLEAQEAKASGADDFDWRAAGWYCQHSYEFCAPCYFGYDHPVDEAKDRADYTPDEVYTAVDGTWMVNHIVQS